MTLKEVSAKRKSLEQELRKLQEMEGNLRNEDNKKKFEGKFIIKKCESFAMHVISVHEGPVLFGEGIRKSADGLHVGRFSYKLPKNVIFVEKEEYLKFIEERLKKELIYVNF